MKRWTLTLLVLLWCIVAISMYATCRADQQPCDCDGTGNVTITDVVALINYIFNGIEPARTEWVEVDTTVSVVQILDRPFTIPDWPIVVQNHFYVTVDDSGRVDTTVIREYIITEATYPSGSQLIKTR